MWKIGDIPVDGRAVLGPMSGFTFPSYRDFMKPFGVAVSFTEMTSCMGVIHDSERTASMYLEFGRNRPTGLQLFGGDPESLAEASAKALKTNPAIDFIDINMGCPVPKVLRSRSGSALMDDPARCGQIVKAVKRRAEVPVTVKTRLGRSMESLNFREVLDEVVSAGADAVTLHARTAKEGYSGEPHFDMAESLQSELPVPLIISGNVFSLDDAVSAVRITGAKGVMVARGGIGNPFLVTQIDRWFRDGRRIPSPTISDQIRWCKELSDAVIAEKGEAVGVRKLRSIAPKFVSGCRMCNAYRRVLATEPETREDLFRILDRIEERMGSERAHATCTHEEY
ncbi:MAG: tRNA-dihydrouridine synthase [Candidatus Methanomethylophilaceae archaeon]|nr:tRNA-dihydrouridine synthase [Candidatus Methanomethylophilaceae archaeon]